jgi:uncharacterized lipoprotein YehR (DUF1307 family)
MKKQKTILLISLAMLLLLTGCSSKTNTKIMKCTGNATIDDASSSVSLHSTVYYQGKYVKVLHSVEKVTSKTSSVLDTYETAYKKINAYYKGLKYYDTTVKRTTSYVERVTTIDYAKIDTKALLKIEGSTNNVIKNGKVKLSTYKSFIEKYGYTCTKA